MYKRELQDKAGPHFVGGKAERLIEERAALMHENNQLKRNLEQVAEDLRREQARRADS